MITPTRIEVRNVRSIPHAVVEPASDGITSLTGPVGSGKSTILNSMLWALYGEVGGVEGLTAQADMRRAGTTDPVEVNVEFDLNGNSYRVVRRLRLNKARTKETASAELWIDGAKQEQITPKKLTEKIEALTGLSGRAFTGAFFIAQNNLPKLAEGTPGEVQALFEQQTGVAALSKQIDAASESARELQIRSDALPGSVEDVKAAQVEVDAAQLEGDRVWPALETAQAQHERARANQQEAMQQWQDLNERAKAARDAHLRIAQLDGQISSATEQQQAARDEAQSHPVRDVSRARERLDALTVAERDARTLNDRAVQAGHVFRDAKQSEQQISVPPQPTGDGQQLRQAAQQAQDAAAQLRAEFRQYNEQLNKLRALDGAHCPTCTQALPDPQKIVAPIAAHLEQITEQGKRAAQQAQRAQIDLDEYTRATQEWESASRAAQEVAQRAQQARSDAMRATQHAEQALTRVRHLCDTDADAPFDQVMSTAEDVAHQLRETVRGADYAQQVHQRLQQIESTVRDLTEQREQARAAMTDAPDDAAVDAAHAQYTKAQTALEEASTELSQRRRDADITAERVSAAEKARDAQQRLVDAKAEATIKADEARHTKDVLVAYRRDLVGEFTAAVSSAATDLMEQVGAGQHIGVHIDHQFVPCVILPDGTQRPMRNLSGGEKMRAALCLRLGIAEQISGTSGDGMIFADEITANHDEESTLHVVELMRALGRPMIVVAHADQVQQIANLVFVFDKPSEEDGTSVTVAEDATLSHVDAATPQEHKQAS